MNYQEAEGSSTPEKPVLPSGRVNVLAIYTKSNQSLEHLVRMSTCCLVI